MPITAAKLALLLAEELERDSCWGDVDPFWIRAVASGVPADYDEMDYVCAIEKVLARVARRLNEAEGS